MFNKDQSDKKQGKPPTHAAYMVRDREGADKKGVWTRIGAFWPHADGKGGDVKLDAFPVNGRVVLRVIEPKSDDGTS